MADVEALLKMRIDPYVRDDPTLMSAGDPLSKAFSALSNGQGRAVIVSDERGHYQGIITEGEILRAHGDPAASRLEHALRRDVPALRLGASLGEAASALRSTNSRALAIVDGQGRAVGLLTREDIIRAASEAGFEALPLGDHATRDAVTIDEAAPISQALALMRHGGFQHLPVLRRGELAGIVTAHDILRNVLIAARAPASDGWQSDEAGSPLEAPVESVMTHDVQRLGPESTYAEAAELMTDRGIGSVVLTDDAGALAGIVTRGDLLEPIAVPTGSVPEIVVQFSSHDVSRDSYEESGAPEVVRGFLEQYRSWIEPAILRLHVKRAATRRTGGDLWDVHMVLACKAGKFHAVGDGENLVHATRMGVEHLARDVRRVKDETLEHPSRRSLAKVLD